MRFLSLFMLFFASLGSATVTVIYTIPYPG